MNRIQLIIGLLVCSFVSSNFSMEKKHIILDLNNILIQPNTGNVAKQIGVWNLLGSMLGGSNPTQFSGQFFTTLRDLDPNKQPPISLPWEGHKAPYPIYELLIGAKKAEDLHAEIRKKIEDKNPKDKNIMLTLADITFHPEKNADIIDSIPAGEKLLDQLLQQGHIVHLHANWGKESWLLLKNKFTDLFQKINGQILISGAETEIKTVKTIQTIMQQYNLMSHQCITIESQSHLCEELKEAGIPSVHSSTNSISDIEKQLRELKILN